MSAQTMTERDHAFVMRVTCISMLVTLEVLWKSYVPGVRILGLAPVLPFLAQLPDIVDWIVFGVCCLLLVWLFVKPSQIIPVCGILLCQLFWILQDIPRMQPFQYMFCFTILITAFYRNHKAVALNALRIMICGVYFWAGFHKINATFYVTVFPWFIQPIYDFSTPKPALMQVFSTMLVVATPFIEAAIGIVLLFPSMRKYGSVFAFIMLVVVLYCLGPLGHNWALAVLPWNIWLFWMEYRLFLNPEFNRGAGFLLSRSMPRILYCSFILFFVAPTLAMFTDWYTYPGFKLYSGNTTGAVAYLAPAEKLTKAPQRMKDAMSEQKLNLWGKWDVSLHYPTAYAYKLAGKGICQYLDYPAEAKLKILYPPPFYSLKFSEELVPLCP